MTELGRIDYSPELAVPMICHNRKCGVDLNAFHRPCILPGNFHYPGRVALLCEPCDRRFWQREAELERDHEG